MRRRWGAVFVGVALLAACSSSDEEPTIAPNRSTTSPTTTTAGPPNPVPSPLELSVQRRGDDSICLLVTERGKPNGGSSSNCEATLLEGQAVSAAGGGLNRHTFATGQVVATASAVRVELDNGRSVQAAIRRVDGLASRPWLAILPDGAVPRAVTVIDEGGREIVRQPM